MKKTIVCLLAILLVFHLQKATANTIAVNETENYRSFSSINSDTAGTSGEAKMQVFPSASVHDYCILNLFSEKKQVTECSLSTEAGVVVQKKKVQLVAGANNISWDLKDLAAGVYYLASETQKPDKIKVTKL
jgi:hypothetical protein